MPQDECFSAALQFARSEGIVPAPEPTHALAACVREALKAKETGEQTVILTALCGHGLLDLPAYEAYLAGQLEDNTLSDETLLAVPVHGPRPPLTPALFRRGEPPCQ